ncbi:MAG: hypothetical protein QM493_01715 [Sulfurovum sp.]
MTNINLKIIKVLLIIDIFLVAISILFFSTPILYNLQIGFISSSLVMFGSITAYKKMINSRVEAIEPFVEDNNIEDNDKEEKESDEDEKEEEKRSIAQSLQDASSALSLYRVSAYVVLILGFLYLNRHGLLHIPSYILSIGIAPIVIVVILLREK